MTLVDFEIMHASGDRGFEPQWWNLKALAHKWLIPCPKQPMIYPYNRSQVNAASYDVCIGDTSIPRYPADSTAYPPPINSPSQWTYRASRQTLDNGEALYAIREFWRDNQGKLTSWSESEIAPVGDTVEDLRWALTKMLEALDKEVIDIGKDQSLSNDQLWSEEEMLKAVRIEEECGCDISAGIDHGINLGDYIAEMMGMNIEDKSDE